jgi:hypothetical protein
MVLGLMQDCQCPHLYLFRGWDCFEYACFSFLTHQFLDDSLKPLLPDTPLLDTDQARTHPLLQLAPPAECLDFLVLVVTPLLLPQARAELPDSQDSDMQLVPLLLRPLSMVRLLDSPALDTLPDKWEVTHRLERPL